MVRVFADLHGAVPDPVVDGGRLDAVPVDGVRRRPGALGPAMEDHPAGPPRGRRRPDSAFSGGIVVVAEDEELNILNVIPRTNGMATHQMAVHRMECDAPVLK